MAYGSYVWWERSREEAREITQAPAKDLKGDQIIKMLTSGDFKQKLQARKEISKLKPQERKRVLLRMSKEKNPATRMMAIQGLKAFLKDPQVKKVMEGLQKDPDADVAAQAKQALGGGK